MGAALEPYPLPNLFQAPTSPEARRDRPRAVHAEGPQLRDLDGEAQLPDRPVGLARHHGARPEPRDLRS